MLIVLDLAERVLAVGAKMPKVDIGDCFSPDDFLQYESKKCMLEQCTLAITGALLSEEELIDILNTLVHPTKKLPGTTVYCVPREVISTIATAIHSAQMEKLGGVR